MKILIAGFKGDDNSAKILLDYIKKVCNEDILYLENDFEISSKQIEEKLNANQDYKLKEGDIVSVDVKNTNQTLSQQLKNFFYSVVGKDTYTIAASHAGIVTATGK